LYAPLGKAVLPLLSDDRRKYLTDAQKLLRQARLRFFGVHWRCPARSNLLRLYFLNSVDSKQICSVSGLPMAVSITSQQELCWRGLAFKRGFEGGQYSHTPPSHAAGLHPIVRSHCRTRCDTTSALNYKQCFLCAGAALGPAPACRVHYRAAQEQRQLLRKSHYRRLCQSAGCGA